jgi:sugar lactone lactonase YvrE
MTKLATLTLVLAAVAGCKKKEAPATTEPMGSATAGSGSAMVGSGSAMAGSGSAEGSGSAAAGAWDGKTALPITDGFQTPESVLYVADQDVYFVSNINGEPLGADDNGFISKIDPETGKVTEAKWIDGSKDTVKLDAPKGMAIADGILYVADISVVRKFDAKTGEPKGEVKINGATFLNDVAVATGGGVWVTDSGLDPKFASTGTDAIYHIGADDKVKPLIKDKALAAPNGIIAGDNGSVWIVNFGSGEIYAVDAKGKKAAGQKLPKGQNDGIVALDGGEYLVTSWEGSAIYRGKPGGEWKPVVENVKSPADIGWDSKRKRVLIPVFQGNSVILQPLQ